MAEMKSVAFFRGLGLRILLSALALIVLGSAFVWGLQRQEEDDKNKEASTNSNTVPAKFYWEEAPPQYPTPDLENLQPEAVKMEGGTVKVFPSLTYALHAFFWWDPGYRNIGLTHLNQMGFSHIRQKFAWEDIEPRQVATDDPGRYIWAQADAMMADIEAKNIEVVARLGSPPAWAVVADSYYRYPEPPFDMERLIDYCAAVAERYKGRIYAYQIWNEPNLEREWGNHSPSPEAYTQLLKACATAIRQADPDTIIVSAGLAPTETRTEDVMPHDEFLWKMYAAGASPYFDVLGVHAPGYRSPPEADPRTLPNGDRPWMSFRHVEYFRAIMIANGDTHKQIAITEMGWTIDQINPAYSWFAVTPEQQGDYLARAYQYAAENWRPWVGLMVTIYYPDPGWTPEDEQYWWAIGTVAPLPFGLDGRPAWPALNGIDKISTNPDYDRPGRTE